MRWLNEQKMGEFPDIWMDENGGKQKKKKKEKEKCFVITGKELLSNISSTILW